MATLANKTVLGIFSDRDHAEATIVDLKQRGYQPKDISVLVKNEVVGQQVADDTGAQVVGGAVSGATTGGVIGGLAGLLVGIGALTIPGIGAIFIAGPLAAALGLTGAAATTVSGAATGALAGGIVGALMGLGLPEETAQVYEQRLTEGAIVLAVPASSLGEDEVEDMFEKHGADQIQTIG